MRVEAPKGGKVTTLLLIAVFISLQATRVVCQGTHQLYFRNSRCKAGICSQGLALLSTTACPMPPFRSLHSYNEAWGQEELSQLMPPFSEPP